MKEKRYKNFKESLSTMERPVNLQLELRCCLGPGDCIFTAGLTAVAFHSGDRWRAFSPNDTEKAFNPLP